MRLCIDLASLDIEQIQRLGWTRPGGRRVSMVEGVQRTRARNYVHSDAYESSPANRPIDAMVRVLTTLVETY